MREDLEKRLEDIKAERKDLMKQPYDQVKDKLSRLDLEEQEAKDRINKFFQQRIRTR